MGEVHRLIEAHGKLTATGHMSNRRPRRIADAAQLTMLDEKSGQLPLLIYSGWAHAGLPHKAIAVEQDWEITTDYSTLVVEPGKRYRPTESGKERASEYVGVPHGPYARLILYYLMDRALETNDTEVELGQTLTDFLIRLELKPGGETRKRVRDQIERIARCRLTFHIHGEGYSGVSNQSIVETAVFFDEDRRFDERHSGPFKDRIRLSQAFFSQLKEHAVRLDERAIRRIANNSRAMDVYSWLAFRLHRLAAPVFIPWSTLRQQFGKSIHVTRNFPAVMKDDTQLALAVYPDAKVDIQDRGLLLHGSPPPVLLNSTKRKIA